MTARPSLAQLRLRARIDALGAATSARTGLAPIYGGGAADRPDWSLVFINPTGRNISSRPGWGGPRFPFIGTGRIWRFLAGAGLLPGRVADRLPARAQDWSEAVAVGLEAELARAGLYLTNVVKSTAPDSRLPSPAEIDRWRQLLHDELELARPRLTVAFGVLAWRALTDQNIRLAEAYDRQLAGRPIVAASCRGLPVAPCYFPVGRGNPRRAGRMLFRLASSRPTTSRPRRTDRSES